MDFENLKEGQPIQNPPLFEKESLLKWKSKFENQDNYLKLDKITKAKTMIFKALVPNMKECIFVKRLMIFGKIY